MTIDSTLQVIFVDALFLCLAAGLALWFRAWLQEQQRRMDRRLEALEEQHQGLERLGERLSSACRHLERPTPAVEAIRPGTRVERPPVVPRKATVELPTPAPPVPDSDRQVPAPEVADPRSAPELRRRVDTPAARADRQWEELTDRSREAYRRARDLLEQGVPANDIAREVGLGVAEVNVLKRMRDAGRH